MTLSSFDRLISIAAALAISASLVVASSAPPLPSVPLATVAVA